MRISLSASLLLLLPIANVYACGREKSCLMMRMRLGIEHMQREREITIIIINDGAKKQGEEEREKEN